MIMTKSMEMEEKVKLIYDYIKDVTDEKGFPPTIRDICSEFGIKSTSSVSYYLRKLQTQGFIKIDYGKKRAVEVVDKAPKRKDIVQVPLIGTITAGQPIFAEENYEDTYSLPQNLFRLNGELFMLHVEGTSMIEAGINNGDKIIIKRQNTASNGQIVAALIDGECATVKRFFNDGKRIRLHPENKNMADLYPDEVSILGIVVGLIRTSIK